MTTSDLHHYHGIDVGGTKIELVSYTDASGDLAEVHRERIATPGADYDGFMQAVTALVARADTALGCKAPVGIGLPGITDSATGRQVSSNVPALNGRQVAAALIAALERPIVIGNDCQCFALSEAQGGAADGLPSMFGAIIGTGAGGGYCVAGRLLRGMNGIAGEWGHWPAPVALLARYDLPDLDCPCGRSHCLERYVSGPGMSGMLAHFGGDRDVPASGIVARAAGGDAIAAHALAVHADLLGHAVATLVLSLDPHAIVLGGGLSQLAHLYRELPAAARRHLPAGVHVPPILPPRFGDAGGARGAALLIKQMLAAPAVTPPPSA
jgi:N-acetylglucosamine kinase